MRPLPFAIKTWFDCFIVLIYSVDKEKAGALLPYPLIHEEHGGKALMAAAFVKSKKFRPAFLPAFMGTSFNLVGYRHMASYQRSDGKKIRGLKIIQSGTNRKFMQLGGNELTQYKFNYNPIVIENNNGNISMQGDGVKIIAKENLSDTEIPLPANSIFESWTHARKYGGPLLYTFEVEPASKTVIITEGSRKHWQPRPVEIIEADIDFFKQSPYAEMNPVLSAAYLVKNIPYSWKKAVKDHYK
jgi:hypothetical protein